jgi:CheY-like chemotaxis protein
VIRLLLADDEDLLRGALAALLELEEDLTVVAEASTSTNAVRLAREHRPDIAVLDLEMPPGQQPAGEEVVHGVPGGREGEPPGVGRPGRAVAAHLRISGGGGLSRLPERFVAAAPHGQHPPVECA